MKFCKSCETEKNEELFYVSNKLKDKRAFYCKECYESSRKKRHQTKNGLISKIYTNQKCSSRKRGHKEPLYTKAELELWLLAKPLFHKLFNEWVNSGYDRMLSPSVDRKKDDQGYSFGKIKQAKGFIWEFADAVQ